MTIVLPALAVAFAAVCGWLAVRVFNRRERWAKWTLAGLFAVPVLYIASFGPACWWFAEICPMPDATIPGLTIRRPPKIYWPLGLVMIYMPELMTEGLARYALFGTDSDPIWCGDDGIGRPISISW